MYHLNFFHRRGFIPLYIW